MRFSKSYYLCDFEFVDLFDTEVIEQVACTRFFAEFLVNS